MTDRDLHERVLAAVARERASTADLISLLAEFDRRRLYLAQGYSSLFAFCTDALHLSESSAYDRIQAARAARKWPVILEHLRAGSITLGAVGALAPHLTDANLTDLLDEARHKSKRDVERIVARIRPRPDVPTVIRKLPAAAVTYAPAMALEGAPGRGAACATAIATADAPAGLPLMPVSESAAVSTAASGSPSAQADGPSAQPMHPSAASAATPPLLTTLPPARPAVIVPLTPERYKIQVTVDREAHDLLREAQDLMRHTVPNGDPAVILSRALRLLVDTLLKNKAAITTRMARPRSVGVGSRTIPSHVRREVWRRDKGQCAYVGPRGRCEARAFIEYHHVVPYARGGAASVDNIELRCRAHNSYEAHLAGLGRQDQTG